MRETGREHPENYWIDAMKAFYVYGGDAVGPYGGAIIPFSGKKNADAYVKEDGGRPTVTAVKGQKIVIS